MDKVTQAERKLTGLCLTCDNPLKPWKAYTLEDEYMYWEYGEIRWMGTDSKLSPGLCQTCGVNEFNRKQTIWDKVKRIRWL